MSPPCLQAPSIASLPSNPPLQEDLVALILHRMRKSLLEPKVLEEAKQHGELVERVAQRIEELTHGLPWVRVAMEATTFLINIACVKRKEEISTNQILVLRRAQLIKQHLEKLNHNDDLRAPALVILFAAACLLQNQTIPRFSICAALRASICSRAAPSTHYYNATKLAQIANLLDWLANQLSLLLLQFTTAGRSELALEQTALQERKGKIIKFLDEQSGTRVVGVYGEGGLGKTTILNAVYEELKTRQNHALVFIELGEPPHSVVSLQEKLLSQLGDIGEKPLIMTEAQGRTELQKTFDSLITQGKVLCLFLDNVWNADQLNDLLPHNLDNILSRSSNCYVLVSSRFKSVTDKLGEMCSSTIEKRAQIYWSYTPLHLTNQEAESLFAKIASSKGKKLDSEKDRELVKTIIPLCSGLPLLIRVCASYVTDEKKRSPKEWKRLAARLLQAEDSPLHGDEKPFAKLETSIDALPKAIQDAYLDAALFFRGEEWEVVTDVLNEDSHDYLECLRDQSIILEDTQRAEDEDDASTITTTTMEVRDVFLALAKKRAGKSGKFYVETRTIDATKVENYESIRGFSGDVDEELWDIASMCNLRFLRVTNAQLLPNKPLNSLHELRFLELSCKDGGQSWTLSELGIAKMKKLRVLRIHNINSDLTNEKFPSELRGLELGDCALVEQLPPSIEDLTKLRRLYVHGAPLQMLPCWIHKLKLLENLVVVGAELKSLPPSIGSLVQLTTFYLLDCPHLLHIPKDLGELSNSLLSLAFYNCGSLIALPQTIGNLSSLQSLNLSNCKSLIALPQTLGNLISLQSLDLSYCKSLTTLPQTLGCLSSLRSLDLSFCENLTTLPETIGNLSSLQSLHLSVWHSLTTLPESLGNLSSLQLLDLSYCKSLIDLPETIGNLSSLQFLNLHYCKSLKALPETLGNLNSLQSLDLSYCESLIALPETLGNLSSLQLLHLSTWHNLSSLQSLDQSSNESFIALPETLGNLCSLQSLHLCIWHNLIALPDTLGNLISLHTLDLSCCESLTSLPKTLGNLISLHSLVLFYCKSLITLPESLGNLSSLYTLDLSYCKSLRALPETVGNLSSLQSLKLFSCDTLTTLPKTLGNLSSLQSLIISCCESLIALPETLGKLNSLQLLNLFNCGTLTSLPETIGNLSSLKLLILTRCKTLRALPETLCNLSLLQSLTISSCKSLKNLPDNIGNLSSLQSLDLSYCESLIAIPDTIGNLCSLESLDLSYCESLVTLPKSLGNLSSLQLLHLSSCKSLTTLPKTLNNLRALESLHLSACKRLVDLPEILNNLSSLQSLHISF